MRWCWWQSGLLGGFTLSLATLVKALGALVLGRFHETDVAYAVKFAAAVFGMGFICGVVGWAGRGLHSRIGWVGDSLAGLAVMLVFFLCCMIMFAPEMLGSNFISGGLPMFGFAALVGLICGPWFARDLRKDLATSQSSRNRDAD
jgi:hypothetical protein